MLVRFVHTYVYLFSIFSQKEKALPFFSPSLLISLDNISIRIAKWNNFLFLVSLLGYVAELPMQMLFFFFSLKVIFC